MPKTSLIADRLRAHAKMYERLAQEAATESVAELFREMARECLGAAADAEAAERSQSDINGPPRKPRLSN